MEPLGLVLILLALVIGGALGWWAGSRPAADLRARLTAAEEEGKALDERFKAAIRDLAAASERAERADALAAGFWEISRELSRFISSPEPS